MNTSLRRVSKPRCYLVYALAPPGLPAREANRIFNEYLADPGLPLPLFHDHFIGQPGGVAVFFVESTSQRDALLDNTSLQSWQVEIQPMIFAYSPAAFDEQASFTLRAYRGLDWEVLQREKRPSYGDPGREAETAQEQDARPS
ncbi:MAG TPA: hypothetical protein VLD63_07835 [Anaerolineales bacterium]|nr:hypothetical protein [Anaerolineales bacterium]